MQSFIFLVLVIKSSDFHADQRRKHSPTVSHKTLSIGKMNGVFTSRTKGYWNKFPIQISIHSVKTAMTEYWQATILIID